MADPGSPGKRKPEDDTTLLVAALNHAWAWYDARMNRGLQVVNYFLVAMALLANAYISALNGKHYAIAALVALSGVGLTAITFAVGYQQMRTAARGELALAELQDRIAGRLEMNLIRMAKPVPATALRYVPSWIAFFLAGLLAVGAALYALIH
jgi:hypothetical protein